MSKIEIKKKIDKNELISYFKDLISELERGIIIVGEKEIILPDEMEFEIEIEEENKKGLKKRGIEWEIEWKEKSEETDEDKESDDSEKSKKSEKKDKDKELKKSEETSSYISAPVPPSAVTSSANN